MRPADGGLVTFWHTADQSLEFWKLPNVIVFGSNVQIHDAGGVEIDCFLRGPSLRVHMRFQSGSRELLSRLVRLLVSRSSSGAILGCPGTDCSRH